VIVRGIERRKIFYCERDRHAFLDRLDGLVLETEAGLYAWALMPNHAHALLRTGKLPLSWLCQRWLGPYATTFNLVHRRAGHLFQNRFKNTLVEEEPYFLNLVRYIHLNPVQSILPVTIDDLDRYPWTGHAALMGHAQRPGQDTGFVLSQFGDIVGSARRSYREFVRDGVGEGAIPDLEGGGLRRSAGGWEFVPKLSGGRERWAFDERILGGSEFVEQALQRVQEQWPLPSNDGAETLDELCGRVANRMDLTQPEICSASLRQCVLDARAIISYLAVRHYGLSMTATARFLCVSRQSVTRALDRAQGACDRQGCTPADFLGN